MAANRFSLTQTVTFATAITLIQIEAATNIALKLRKISLAFEGTVNTETPIDIELMRQTTAGTMSAATLYKLDPGRDETIQATGQHTATVEPTASDIIDRWYIHPQSGLVVPFFDEDVIIPGGGFLGIKIATAPDASTICNAVMQLEE